jgi:hypothetical protein
VNQQLATKTPSRFLHHGFPNRSDAVKLLLLSMFLGNLALSSEDNILTLINELFTGQFLPVKSGFFLSSRRNGTSLPRHLRPFMPLLRAAITAGFAVHRRALDLFY